MPGSPRGCVSAAGRACIDIAGRSVRMSEKLVTKGGSQRCSARMRRARTFRNTSISVPVGTEYAAPPSLYNSYPAASAACRARPALSPKKSPSSSCCAGALGEDHYVGIPQQVRHAVVALDLAGTARRARAATWWK